MLGQASGAFRRLVVLALAMAAGCAASTESPADPPVTLQASAPTFEPAAGSYAGSVAVTLRSSTGGATIRYTTDGSTPNASSTRYTAPFTLSSTATVRAFAQATGFRDSAPTSAAYTINAAGVRITISPETYSALSQELVVFTAKVTGTTDTAVTWSVQPATGCGSVNGGAWTAPAVAAGSSMTCRVVATSHADTSKTATATATVSGSLDPELAILAGKLIYLGHQSVGGQLVTGVQAIVDASSGAKPAMWSVSSLQAGHVVVGRWVDDFIGDNYWPLTKIADFRANLLGAGGAAMNALGAGKSIALMKLCFVDVQGSWFDQTPNPDQALFDAYQAMVNEVTAQRPNVRLVHMTMPICPGDVPDNARREAYNARLRAAHGSAVFDLAGIESTDATGHHLAGTYGPYAYEPYTNAPDCHLSAQGIQLLSRKLVQFLAQ